VPAVSDMKMWKSSGSLAVLFVFMLNANLPLRSQAPATETPPKRSAAATTAAGDSPIRFVVQPIDFRLDSSETPERHAPETMAGAALRRISRRFAKPVESSMVERNQSIWRQFVGQLFTRKQFINCEDIRCHLVEFDV
jgi:hypothetical protein